ncbi:addiction module antitoxin [Rhizobium sp. Root274]|uniref:type II toxin-antitoxin system ParD family antitoxin n=1 Tax=unclassified Rhizobium TaxID=2613769 RepID=UPI000712408C|nr:MULTISPECIES: type II toxin-antitoxin system ParD family antitoxin [unclassified Rhizobium]KQW31017.1 addiction module antitoxin [Rhizobium sp. Root1240]KRD32565.1 addiction module antitoxin [Rhizobium sp. Root274]
MPSIQLSQQDAEFVEEQMNSGLYESADAVVTAGLALLRERDEATLRMLIQEGIDDVEAGRVHTYENAEAFLADMKRMFEDAREP